MNRENAETNSSSDSLKHEQIAYRAHEIWDAAGRPAGRDLDNWLQAENELLWQRHRSNAHLVRIDPQAPV
jgi:hypothetical protein